MVGQDTAERLIMEKYYGGTTEGLRSAFESVASAGCSFIVAGRVNDDNGPHRIHCILFCSSVVATMRGWNACWCWCYAHHISKFYVHDCRDGPLLSGVFETFDADVECTAVGIDPGLFRTMSEEEFRMDISSSELRAKGRGLT